MPRPISTSGTDGADSVIRSPVSPTLRFVRSLQRRKTRWQERAFLVEGPRAVADALATGARPTLVLLREDAAFDLAPTPSHDAHAPLRRVAPALFDALADTVTPQGVLAVFPFPDVPQTKPGAPLFLVLDRLRDPGNVGTLLRTAAGAGVTAVYLTPQSVDPYNPKTVRAAMGAHFRLPIRDLAAIETERLVDTCPLRVVADASSTLPYDALDWTQPALLVVGSEADGPSDDTRRLATNVASIPLAAGVESLNAAVAGSIILFEAARQRRRGPHRGAKPPANGRAG